MSETTVIFPEPIQAQLRQHIREAGGNEVFFVARVEWTARGGRALATVDEVEVVARGNATSVLVLPERAAGWDLTIHNHPSGRLEPSDADHAIAHELGQRSVGFAIISNDAARHYVVVAPLRDRSKPEPVGEEEVRAAFAPGGPLSGGLADYEARQGQVDMACAVARALNEDRILAAEAGTGVGKSFAYLLPAILWAVRNRRRVIVSTGTINLQEQLTGKDLPFLARVLPVKFQFALIKGRGNYACRRKAAELEADLRQKDFFEPQEEKQLRDLVQWVGTTGDGSRSSLAWVPSSDAWDRILSESDKSLRVRCEHYERCFYYEAKRAASRADILVVNHHLFFADLAVRRETGNYEHDLVVPRYDRVIFDEAHHLEDVATGFFGLEVSKVGVESGLGRLVSTRDAKRGVLPSLIRRLRRFGDAVAADAIERSYPLALMEARERLDDLFDEAEEAVRGLGEPGAGAPRGREGGGHGVALAADAGAAGLQVRYRPDAGQGARWEALTAILARMVAELERLLAANDRALKSLELSRLGEEQIEAQSLELRSFGRRLEGLIQRLKRFNLLDEEGQVRWVELREKRGREQRRNLELRSAPIRVAAALRDAVYDPLRTVVLTSATLSVAGSIEFLADRLGLLDLDASRFEFRRYDSPFDFRTQALTLVPTDLPSPDGRGFESAVPPAVLELLRASRGRAFVLFTSYSLLRRTFAALEPELRALGLVPVAQGQASRSDLLERFRAGTSNVLFGTDSFWEGVDVKGKALEHVIITRLPFRVPSEPIQEARVEELEARGLNPFTAFTVPQAVLKLKQGFGRLIRSQTDRGVVTILDRRVLSKPYGKVFLASLPPSEVVAAPLGEVVARVARFLGGEADVPVADRAPAGELAVTPPPVAVDAPPWEAERAAAPQRERSRPRARRPAASRRDPGVAPPAATDAGAAPPRPGDEDLPPW
jgi:ATP-dependent DNA helicase DinG